MDYGGSLAWPLVQLAPSLLLSALWLGVGVVLLDPAVLVFLLRYCVCHQPTSFFLQARLTDLRLR